MQHGEQRCEASSHIHKSAKTSCLKHRLPWQDQRSGSPSKNGQVKRDNHRCTISPSAPNVFNRQISRSRSSNTTHTFGCLNIHELTFLLSPFLSQATSSTTIDLQMLATKEIHDPFAVSNSYGAFRTSPWFSTTGPRSISQHSVLSRIWRYHTDILSLSYLKLRVPAQQIY